MADPPGDEPRFRAIVERSPAVVYLRERAQEPPGGLLITYVSPQIERVLGLPPEAWTADPTAWWDHIHPDDRSGVRVALARAEQRGAQSSIEYRMRAAGGG